jgi:hypothetical protein
LNVEDEQWLLRQSPATLQLSFTSLAEHAPEVHVALRQSEAALQVEFLPS